MTKIDSDICDVVASKGGILVHQVNCKRAAGAGLAREIRWRWPTWYEFYRRTYPVLGNVSMFEAEAGVWIASLYAQRNWGQGHTQTDYEALRLCLSRLRVHADKKEFSDPSLFFPWRIGCGLAGGNWDIVRPMVEAAFPGAAWVRLVERKAVRP